MMSSKYDDFLLINIRVFAVPLNLNLEINVAQPPRTTPRYMHGDVSESAVEELMQDLIH